MANQPGGATGKKKKKKKEIVTRADSPSGGRKTRKNRKPSAGGGSFDSSAFSFAGLGHRPETPQPRRSIKLIAVVRCVALHVVVEVDEDVLAAVGPAATSLGPFVERPIGVAAGVELLVAVQPCVPDGAGVLVDLRPAARRVGQHRGDARGAAARRRTPPSRTSSCGTPARSGSAGRPRLPSAPGRRGPCRRGAGRARRLRWSCAADRTGKPRGPRRRNGSSPGTVATGQVRAWVRGPARRTRRSSRAAPRRP